MSNDEKVLINFYIADKNSEPVKICGFRTSIFAEWIKLFQYCKEYNVTFWVREDDTSINPELIQKMSIGAMVEDYYVEFGSNEVIQTISVILK